MATEDLRSTIEAAVVESETNEAASVQVESAPVSGTSGTEPTKTVSDDQSTSEAVGTTDAKTSNGDTPSIEEVVGTESKVDLDKAETPEQKEARSRVDRAPQSWKGEAKKVWETLPLQVRQEVARRERDISVTMQAAAQDRQRVQQINDVITPHMDRINSVYGGNAVQAFTNLLAVERQLFNGTAVSKAQLIANMVKQFGVDVRALDAAIVGSDMPEQTQAQSDIESLLERKLAPMQQFIQSQQQREQQERQRAEANVTNAVQEMASDPQYPYFNDVREDMADIIEMGARKGVAISLPDAYNKAVRMNDGTFAASSVRDSTQSATQQALDAHRAAQAAKGASVSVSGAPTGNGKNAGNPSDLRGTIEASFGGGRL